MRRYFNTEGLCDPEEHYMVRLDERLDKIKRLYIDRGKYFVINRGRQYGKTTTLQALAEYLKKEYLVVSMDFQMMSTVGFENEDRFVNTFTRHFVTALKDETDAAIRKELAVLEATGFSGMDEMFRQISSLCKASPKPVVLIIDEVDSASNNQVFLDFLAQLRGYYLDRKQKPTFRSVVFAGVYDIKNLKLKIRPEEEHRYNSPWNIAAKFRVDMGFTAGQIAGMLLEYEEENGTGMDTEEAAQCIYDYTSGYPYLVSAICKLLDEEISESDGFEDSAKVWSKQGIGEAVKILLDERTPLFDSMVKQFDTFGDLRRIVEEILYQGKVIPYSPLAESVNLGMMFGFLREKNRHIAVSNRIFEMALLNLFMTEEAVGSEAFRYGEKDKNQFVQGARLDMDRVLRKFSGRRKGI